MVCGCWWVDAAGGGNTLINKFLIKYKRYAAVCFLFLLYSTQHHALVEISIKS